MTKRFTDKDTYDFIINTLNKHGLNEDIIKVANKMDVDLVRIFYEKILCVKETLIISQNIDVICKTLLGIYGNYIATCYYKNLGYDVKNEYGVYQNGTLITRADIAFFNHDGDLNFCEVKAAPQIIDNIRNYNSKDEEKYNGKYYYDMDKDILKYKEIGSKLIKQVSKLVKTGKKVMVVIFDGCFMDDIIKDRLNKMGANIFKLAVNINDLEDQIYDMVFKVTEDLKSENTFKNALGDK